MASRVVPAAPAAGHDATALDIPELQVLVEMDPPGELFYMHILHYRLGAGRWVTSDAEGHVDVDDLTELDVVPLTRAAPLPLAGRPYRICPAYTTAALDAIRGRARQMAEIHGWIPPVAGAPGAAPAGVDAWFFADPSVENFGKEASPSVLTNPAYLLVQGAVALAFSEVGDGLAARWTVVERVLRSDYDDWIAAKRSGAGRDRRLIFHDKKSDGRPLLLRDLARHMDQAAKPNPKVFDGPSALQEITRSVEGSGLEFVGWGTQYLTTSGIGQKSGLAVEFMQGVYSLHYMHCVDGLDGMHLAAAEHIARRLLQIQKAVKRNPKNPDFDSLSGYSRHLVDSTGAAYTPAFDKHMAELQKTEAMTLKQDRLQREEESHERERQKKKGDK